MEWGILIQIRLGTGRRRVSRTLILMGFTGVMVVVEGHMIANIPIDLEKWVEVEGRLLENERPAIVGLIIEHLVHYGDLPTCGEVRKQMRWNLQTWDQVGKDLCEAFCLSEAPDLDVQDVEFHKKA
jgi:hypothetical protein